MLFVDAGDNRVGIGAAPDLGAGLHIKLSDSGASVSGTYDTLIVEESGHSGIQILSGTSSTGLLGFNDSGGVLRGFIAYNHSTNNMEFGGNTGAERMRIDSDGDVFIGTTLTAPNPGIYLNNAGQMNIGNNNGTNGQDFLIFRRNAANIGSVIQNGTTGVSYLTSSDYRLKENVVTDWNATTRLKQLKPSRFNFITEPDRTVDGFLAHEVSSIVPEAINGTKDEMETITKVVVDASGNVIAEGIEEDAWTAGKEDETYPTNSTWEASKVVPKYQGIDQSKLVPLLVKTIQELEARITTLEG